MKRQVDARTPRERADDSPREFKTPGDIAWCWQTVAHLKTMLQTRRYNSDRLREVLEDVERYKVWEKVGSGADKPYGSFEAMWQDVGNGLSIADLRMGMERLNGLDDVESSLMEARARVDRALESMRARDLADNQLRERLMADGGDVGVLRKVVRATKRLNKDYPDTFEVGRYYLVEPLDVRVRAQTATTSHGVARVERQEQGKQRGETRKQSGKRQTQRSTFRRKNERLPDDVVLACLERHDGGCAISDLITELKVDATSRTAVGRIRRTLDALRGQKRVFKSGHDRNARYHLRSTTDRDKRPEASSTKASSAHPENGVTQGA